MPKRQSKATKRATPLSAEEGARVECGLRELNREVTVPVRTAGIVSISCKPFDAEMHLSAIAVAEFQGAIDKLIAADPEDAEHIEALADWAADEVAKDAMYYYLNLDLPGIIKLVVPLALQAAARRAIDRLPEREPKGEFGLRDDAERAAWARFKECVRSRSETRQHITDAAAGAIGKYLEDMKGSAGAPHRPHDISAAEALLIVAFEDFLGQDMTETQAARKLRTLPTLDAATRVRLATIKDSSIVKGVKRLQKRATILGLTRAQLLGILGTVI